MQNQHNFMQDFCCFGRKKASTKAGLGLLTKMQGGIQAIETAMKASKNIRTAPAKGKTIGIIGTMESTGSSSTAGTSWACASWLEWSTGLDMAAPEYWGKLM
jgi:hypothetical protein